jgi:Tol biopolymer transport system component
MMKRILLLISFFSAGPSFSFSQVKETDPKVANEKFANGNFADALEDYLDLLEGDPKNDKYNYRVGICYLNTNINKAKAIPYLEIVTRSAKYEPDAMFLMGRAYQFGYRFDDAIKSFTRFKQGGKGTSENLKDAETEIQYCYNAKELMKFPLNVTFENLGKNINSEFSDYFGFVPSDESFVVFNSRRSEGKQRNPDGSYNASIYISKVKEGSFQKAKQMPQPISTNSGDAEVVGLSANGDVMLIYYNDMQGSDDIYISLGDKSNNFKKPERLPDNINAPKGTEIAASVTADGGTIYFASFRTGGIGGTDIYMSKKLPTGEWSPAQNLGIDINTELNEDFPNISPDGKTLYFSSSGHTSMGGYDIFKADWDDASQKWVNVKNLGYPINTPDDDYNFRVSKSGRFGYISAVRDKGFGDLDIYRVTFNDVEPDYTIIKGGITCIDSTKKISYPDVFITVTDTRSGEIFGNYTPNPNSGKYVIIVPPGQYSLGIEAAGYDPVNEKLTVLDKGSFKKEIGRELKLTPEGYIPPQPPKKDPGNKPK